MDRVIVHASHVLGKKAHFIVHNRLISRTDVPSSQHNQIQLHVTLPLGIVNHATITCTALDTASCRVQYG
jgi:hypothetical protein